jgi:hypothetical protein
MKFITVRSAPRINVTHLNAFFSVTIGKTTIKRESAIKVNIMGAKAESLNLFDISENYSIMDGSTEMFSAFSCTMAFMDETAISKTAINMCMINPINAIK